MAIDVMIDLETTGVSAGCCVLSIGAVSLDLDFQFYEKISHPSCLHFGLTDSSDTMSWWSKQSAEARMEAFSGTKDLQLVLGSLADFLASIERIKGEEVFVWGNGADFDLPILGKAYEVTDMKKPWKPFNGRCYRTMKNCFPMVVMDKERGMKHNALYDAIAQAKHLRKILGFRKELLNK